MTDTIGYEAAKAINANVTNSLVDNLVHQYAWYAEADDYGTAKATQVNNTCCLGYEDIFGNKYDMMDGVDLPNDSGNQGKWRIWLPEGGTMMVKGTTTNDLWTTAVAHGKWMAIVPVGTTTGSSSTYYADKYWISSSAGRVVYRGYSVAYAGGGVSYALRCFVRACAYRLASSLPRQAREGAERGGVQSAERGGVKRKAERAKAGAKRQDEKNGVWMMSEPRSNYVHNTGEAGRKILRKWGTPHDTFRFTKIYASFWETDTLRFADYICPRV